MKKLKPLLLILLIAALSIIIWESVWLWLTPTRWHEQHLRHCIKTYKEYQEALNTVLPRLQAQEAPAEEGQMILDPLIAYVRGDSPDARMIDIPLASIGDFYQHTYTYGLVWAADYDHLLTQNPDLILVSLESGWCAYASTRPQ